MNLLHVSLITIYLLLTVTFFQQWFDAYKRDQSMDEDDIFISKIVLAVATLFWPIVVPISYLKLLKKSRKISRKRYQTAPDPQTVVKIIS